MNGHDGRDFCMNTQIIRETIETEQPVSMNPIQTAVETEALLPGGLRDEARLFYAGAAALPGESESSGSRLVLSGKVIFRVLFSQGDLTRVQPLEVTASYAQPVSLPAGLENVSLRCRRVFAVVEQTTAKLASGRVLLRAVLRLEPDLVQEKNVSLVSRLDGNDCAEYLTRTTETVREAGEGEVQDTLRDEFELSDVLQVESTLFATGYAQPEDVSLTPDGKARVTGTVHIEAYHTSRMPQRPLIYTRHTMPYEQEIALSGEKGNLLSALTQVRDIAVLSQDGAENTGEKTMRCETVVRSRVCALESSEKSLLEDLYTTCGENLTAVKGSVSLCTQAAHADAAESVRCLLPLPDGAPRLAQPLLGFLNPVPVSTQRAAGRLIVNGVLQATLVYMTDDSQVPVSAQAEAPFSVAYTTDAQPEDRLTLFTSDVELSALTSDKAEIKYILHMAADGARYTRMNAVTDVAENEKESEPCGVSLCFLQMDETLWDVAKRYRVAKETLARLNPDLTGEPSPGQALLMYRRHSQAGES